MKRKKLYIIHTYNFSTKSWSSRATRRQSIVKFITFFHKFNPTLASYITTTRL